MADAEFWRDLEEKFRALAEGAIELLADWDEKPGEPYRSWVFVGPHSVRIRFEALAIRAGSALDASVVDPVFAWLDAIKVDAGPYVKTGGFGTAHPSGRVINLCAAAADLCSACESLSLRRSHLLRKGRAAEAERIEEMTYRLWRARQVVNTTTHETLTPPSRTDLRDHYMAAFPDERILILDICWAVGQHYREWKRWIKGQLPDRSTADLAFRRILTSKKRPLEFNPNVRPSSWQ